MRPEDTHGVGDPDPEEAEAALRRADALGVGGPELADRLDAAGSAYRRRFWDAGDLQDLHKAVGRYRRAARADPARRAVWTNETAVALTDLYDLTGDLGDLAAAREAAEEATDAAEEGSPQWARCAATLVLCLWNRYDATGTLGDLEAAIEVGTRALGALPRTDAAWARVCSNVGMLHMDRYERLREDDDLQASVRLSREAVDAALEDDPELGGWWNNLGNALLTRFGAQFPDRALPRPGEHVDLTDVDAAVAAYETALRISRWKFAGRPTFLVNLGNARVDRAEALRLAGRREEAVAALREAVVPLTEAVSLTSRTAPYRASRLNVLGEARRALADETGAADEIDTARAAFREACGTGLDIAPEMTVGAADNWIRWATRRAAWEEVGEADGYLLRAARALHEAQAVRRHREAWLVASHGLAHEGAYALARLGRAEAAAVRLERGRAVLLSEELALVPALLDRLPRQYQDRYTAAVRRVQEALRDGG
jgi:tetratricopeptide (TPR) repeat protein